MPEEHLRIFGIFNDCPTSNSHTRATYQCSVTTFQMVKLSCPTYDQILSFSFLVSFDQVRRTNGGLLGHMLDLLGTKVGHLGH